MSDSEKDKERQRQLDLMKVAVGNDDFDDEDDDDEGLSARGRSKTGPGRDEAMESARRFLWDEDAQEVDIPLEGGNIKLSGTQALFSSQDYGIDQGVNYMEGARPQSSRGGGLIGSVFQGQGMRDAASSESEEYISTRRRRSSGRMASLCNSKCMLLMVAVVAVVLGVGTTIALVNKDVATASSPRAPAEPEEASIRGSTPEKPEEEEQPVNPPGEPEEEPASGGIGEPEEEVASQLTDEERFEALKTKLNIEKASTHQQQALDWLAKQDPSKIDPEDEFMLQRYTLAVLFFQTGGFSFQELGTPPSTTWNIRENWMTEKGYCSWYGVECIGDAGEVHVGNADIIAVNLTSNALQGYLPTEIGLFPSIEELDLSHNDLFGLIPTEVGNLQTLRSLDLSRNGFRDSISSELGKLVFLHELHLGGNNLQRALPDSMTQLASLRTLDLEKNELTGTLPDFSLMNNLRE
jgi:hypothetical protein